MGELRERKKRETRERISDVATALFFERGFEAVTVDEIAAAAGVSKMTVFNYFARKEELMLDREEDLKLLPLRQALHERPKGQSAVNAMRGVLRALIAEKHPLAYVHRQSVRWWRVIAASPSLQARLRELADEAAEGLAIELGGPKPDGLAQLTAAMIVATVRTARAEAIRQLDRGASEKKANAVLHALLERGLTAIETIAHPSASKRVVASAEG